MFHAHFINIYYCPLAVFSFSHPECWTVLSLSANYLVLFYRERNESLKAVSAVMDRLTDAAWAPDGKSFRSWCVYVCGERGQSKQQTETVCQTSICCLNNWWSKMKIRFWFTASSLALIFKTTEYMKMNKTIQGSRSSQWIRLCHIFTFYFFSRADIRDINEKCAEGSYKTIPYA